MSLAPRCACLPRPGSSPPPRPVRGPRPPRPLAPAARPPLPSYDAVGRGIDARRAAAPWPPRRTPCSAPRRQTGRPRTAPPSPAGRVVPPATGTRRTAPEVKPQLHQVEAVDNVEVRELVEQLQQRATDHAELPPRPTVAASLGGPQVQDLVRTPQAKHEGKRRGAGNQPDEDGLTRLQRGRGRAGARRAVDITKAIDGLTVVAVPAIGHGHVQVCRVHGAWLVQAVIVDHSDGTKPILSRQRQDHRRCGGFSLDEILRHCRLGATHVDAGLTRTAEHPAYPVHGVAPGAEAARKVGVAARVAARGAVVERARAA
eukprot:scaffold47230_cov63-Phaeocystis_antarctica.AAC.1